MINYNYHSEFVAKSSTNKYFPVISDFSVVGVFGLLRGFSGEASYFQVLL